MEAVKFLRPGRVGPFSGVTWPAPGTWLESSASPELCRAGVHAILPAVLAIWIAEELWRVELERPTAPTRGVVVAPRGRLLSRQDSWNDKSAREFAHACAARAREHAMGRAAEFAAEATAAAEAAVADDSAARVAYMAAHAAEAMTPGSFVTERRWQSRWLAQRLGVTDVEASTPATHDRH
jgi:hypothetical protein